MEGIVLEMHGSDYQGREREGQRKRSEKCLEITWTEKKIKKESNRDKQGNIVSDIPKTD